jgi:hypothetical protein
MDRLKAKLKKKPIKNKALKFMECDVRLENNKLITVTDTKDLVGVELEVGFSPDLTKLPDLYEAIDEEGKITTMTSLVDVAADIIKNYSSIVSDRPHMDGGGLESILYPTSLEAHSRLRTEYVNLLEIYEDLGFTDTVPGAGIHLNIDLSLFDPNKFQGLVNFYNFLFYYNDFFMYFCGRYRLEAKKSSMRSMLRDFMHRKRDIRALKQEFLADKGSAPLKRIIERYESDYYVESSYFVELFNTTLFKDKRPCLEWRWFGSTLDVNKLMAFIEMGFALPKYCASVSHENLISFEDFERYIMTNSNLYPNLIPYFLEIKTISNDNRTSSRQASQRQESVAG